MLLTSPGVDPSYLHIWTHKSGLCSGKNGGETIHLVTPRCVNACECKLSYVWSPMESGCIQLTRSMTKNVEYGFQLVLIFHFHVTLCSPNSTGLSWCTCLCVCVCVFCCKFIVVYCFSYQCWASCLSAEEGKSNMSLSPPMKGVPFELIFSVLKRERERENGERVWECVLDMVCV